MNMMKNLAITALLTPVIFLSGCGKENTSQPSTSQPSAESTAPAEAAAPAASDSMPWSSLNANQKSVLSVAESIWPTIPLAKKQSYVAIADNWGKTEAADQWKMLNELRDYAHLPHVGPDATKKSKK